MIKIFKNKYLPAWERDRYEKHIAFLVKANEKLKEEAKLSKAYTDGLHESIRAIRKITIYNEVKQ